MVGNEYQSLITRVNGYWWSTRFWKITSWEWVKGCGSCRNSCAQGDDVGVHHDMSVSKLSLLGFNSGELLLALPEITSLTWDRVAASLAKTCKNIFLVPLDVQLGCQRLRLGSSSCSQGSVTRASQPLVVDSAVLVKPCQAMSSLWGQKSLRKVSNCCWWAPPEPW